MESILSENESQRRYDEMCESGRHQPALTPLRAAALSLMLSLPVGLFIGFFVNPVGYIIVVAIPLFVGILYARRLNVRRFEGRTIASMVVRNAGELNRYNRNPVTPTTSFEKAMYQVIPFHVDLFNYIMYKSNQHILIAGISGTGKTVLTNLLLCCRFVYSDEKRGVYIDTQKYQRIVISFKKDDRYAEELPYKRVDAFKELPNPFTDVESFIRAFLVTYAPERMSIQPSLIPPLLYEIVNDSANWQDFTDGVQYRLHHEKDDNKLAALSWIEEQSKALIASSEHAKSFNLPTDIDVLYDLGELGNREHVKCFYAEILLNQLWTSLTNKERRLTIICVDEAHRLMKHGTADYSTILNNLLREARSLNAWVWIATQNYHDTRDELRNQFATQLIFHTSSEADLEALMRIDVALGWAATNLPSYHFVDTNFPEKATFIPIWYYVPGRCSPLPQPVAHAAEQAPDTAPREQPAAPVRPAINYLRQTREILYEGPNYQTEIAREILKRNNLPVTTESVRLARVHVKSAWVEIRKEGMFDSMPFDRGQRLKTATLIYETGPNMSKCHEYMQNETVKVLVAGGESIIHTAKQGEDSCCDIETEMTMYEIETGLKRKYDDLVARISKTRQKNIVIVTPNKEVKAKYAKFATEFKGMSVITFGELVDAYTGLSKEGETSSEGGLNLEDGAPEGI